MFYEKPSLYVLNVGATAIGGSTGDLGYNILNKATNVHEFGEPNDGITNGFDGSPETSSTGGAYEVDE